MVRSTLGLESREAASPATVPCPECGCGIPTGAEICEICLADLGERPMALSATDLPPAAMVELRFDDVVAELEALARLAAEREEVSEAALRAGSLLARLRTQFTRDLGLPHAPAGSSSGRPRPT